MTSLTRYNKLYNNKAYNTLARSLAVDMQVNYNAPTLEYLKVMVAVQDMAITYSQGDIPEIPCNVAEWVWQLGSRHTTAAYLRFMAPFVDYWIFNNQVTK